jgi:hypothetical protein
MKFQALTAGLLRTNFSLDDIEFYTTIHDHTLFTQPISNIFIIKTPENISNKTKLNRKTIYCDFLILFKRVLLFQALSLYLFNISSNFIYFQTYFLYFYIVIFFFFFFFYSEVLSFSCNQSYLVYTFISDKLIIFTICLKIYMLHLIVKSMTNIMICNENLTSRLLLSLNYR